MAIAVSGRCLSLCRDRTNLYDDNERGWQE